MDGPMGSRPRSAEPLGRTDETPGKPFTEGKPEVENLSRLTTDLLPPLVTILIRRLFGEIRYLSDPLLPRDVQLQQ